MQVILNLLYIYVAIYTVYFFTMAVKNLFDKKYKVERMIATSAQEESLAVVIYSHNDKPNLEKLINQLKHQTYSINFFRIFVILDNCIDGSEELFENERFITVINVKDIGTIGKDEAVSQFIKRYSADRDIDAYVFIDGNRSIPADFLVAVNSALKSANVICGETIVLFDSLSFTDKIKSAFQKYRMNFLQKARGLFGLASFPDSGVLVVRKPILDQIRQIDFKTIDDELKYNLLLSRIGTPCIYNPNIRSCVETTYEYQFRRPQLWTKLKLFCQCFTKIFTKNFVFTEHVFSLLQPNICATTLIFAGLLIFSSKYYFFVGFKGIVLTLMFFIVGFLLSLLNSRLTWKESIYLAMYPIWSIFSAIKHFPPIANATAFIVNKIKGIDKIEKFSVDIMDEVKNRNNQIVALPCRLEFISENDFARVRFIYKRQSYTTDKHIRMFDALQELRLVAKENGHTLKICACCEYFQSINDGSKNMLKGCCNCNKPSITIDPAKETLVWNSCGEFKASKKVEVYGGEVSV